MNDIIKSKNIDLKSLSLTEADVERINEVRESIGTVDTLTISSYGKGISSRNGEYTKELLSLVTNSDLDKTGEKLNEVITTVKSINTNSLISKNKSSFSKLPVIGGLFRSVEKAKENFAMKYNDTNKQLETLIAEIDQNQGGLTARIELLGRMSQAVEVDIKEIGVYIASGQMLLSDIQDEINTLTNVGGSDPITTQRIYDLNSKYNTLDKRLHDLYCLQQANIQMLPQIQIIQTNNTLLVDKFHTVQTITIPAWKSQITMAIALNEQKNSVDLANTIDDATNDLLRRNAELLYSNSVKTAKAANRAIVDADTLAYTQDMLIKTVNDVIKVQHEGYKDREVAKQKLKALQQNYEKIVVADSIKLTLKDHS